MRRLSKPIHLRTAENSCKSHYWASRPKWRSRMARYPPECRRAAIRDGKLYAVDNPVLVCARFKHMAPHAGAQGAVFQLDGILAQLERLYCLAHPVDRNHCPDSAYAHCGIGSWHGASRSIGRVVLYFLISGSDVLVFAVYELCGEF